MQSAARALCEAGVQLQSQRMELHQANQLTDQSQTEKSCLCNELDMRNKASFSAVASGHTTTDGLIVTEQTPSFSAVAAVHLAMWNLARGLAWIDGMRLQPGCGIFFSISNNRNRSFTLPGREQPTTVRNSWRKSPRFVCKTETLRSGLPASMSCVLLLDSCKAGDN